MKSNCMLAILAVILLLASVSGNPFICSALAQTTANLVSDKADYAPGEVVVLTGAGFEPFEAIDISLSVDNPEVGLHVADYDWNTEVADQNGVFVSAYFTVPELALNTTITATAMGLNSGLVAKAVFTDAAAANVNFATSGLPAGVWITVSYSGTNNGGNSISGNSTFTSPGPSSNIGTQQGSSFTYSSFPASITVGSDAYNLDSTSPASPFNTPSSSPPVPTTTVTATYIKYAPPTTCPTNSAPTITASDLDAGEIIGCLTDGEFQTTISISVNDFFPVVSDPDGDPVTVTLNVTEVTLVGPGTAEADVTLTATDNPNGRNAPPCADLEPQSATASVKVKAKVVYQFEGFNPPLKNDAATMIKKGSTVPVKFRLYDCGGTEICSVGKAPVIDVKFQAAIVPAGDPEITDSGNSNDNGTDFRYSGTCGIDGNWIYNLQTKTGYVTGATYGVSVQLDDDTTHVVSISIKK